MKHSILSYSLLFIFSLAVAGPVFAQENDQDTTSENSVCQDSTDQEQVEFHWFHKKHHKNMHYEFWDYGFGGFKNGGPFMQVNYGRSENKINSLLGSMDKTGYAQVKLGHEYQKPVSKKSSVLKYNSHYAEFAIDNADLWKNNTVGNLDAESVMFGIGWDKGYGYAAGSSAFLFTTGNGFGWTRLRINNAILHNSDVNKLAYFDDTFRFGIKSESSIKMQFIPALSVDVSYERAQVYQRVLFWKMGASLITEAACQGLLDEFIGKVLKSSPTAAPILNFVLKSGLSYGIYELRKDAMNFPFGGEDPLMKATYKIGMTFNF